MCLLLWVPQATVGKLEGLLLLHVALSSLSGRATGAARNRSQTPRDSSSSSQPRDSDAVTDSARFAVGSKVLFKWPAGSVPSNAYSYDVEFSDLPRDASRPVAPALVIESVRPLLLP